MPDSENPNVNIKTSNFEGATISCFVSGSSVQNQKVEEIAKELGYKFNSQHL